MIVHYVCGLENGDCNGVATTHLLFKHKKTLFKWKEEESSYSLCFKKYVQHIGTGSSYCFLSST